MPAARTGAEEGRGNPVRAARRLHGWRQRCVAMRTAAALAAVPVNGSTVPWRAEGQVESLGCGEGGEVRAEKRR